VTDSTPAPEGAPPIKIFGSADSPAAYTLRDYLQRSQVPFTWEELSSDEQAQSQAGVPDLGDPRLPLCVFPDGRRLEAPSLQQVNEHLGWFHPPQQTEYDLVIYGAGPAGLSAAVYGASEGLKTVVIEPSAIGGQAGTSSKIENYLGFPGGISGAELAERAREQAHRFGAEFLVSRSGVSGVFSAGLGIGELEDGTRIRGRTNICATGIQYRRLGLPREELLLGAGVYYGAGSSEAPLYLDETVIVVGGGNSAGQAVMNFAQFARRVVVVVRGASLASTLSSYLLDRIQAASHVEVMTQTEVTQLSGESRLESVTLRHLQSGELTVLETRGLFICIGGVPQTDWAAEVGIVRDPAGYLLTGPDLLLGRLSPATWALERAPYYLETSTPGVFAAGDVRHGSVKRFASAVGEGAMAVTFAHRYLAEG
jgi:thioredoxin reductase (NADPH)